MIKVENIYKSFGSAKALNGFGINIKEGEVHALMGPNGSGKTTALRIIRGDILPDRGNITVFNSSDTDRVKENVAVVTEDRLTVRNFTIFDYMHLYELLYPAWDGKGFYKNILQSGLKGKQRLSELSGGQKTIVMNFLALFSGASVLILDEPVQHLDPVFRGLISRRISEYAEKPGKAVLISSHEIYELEEVATDFTIISGGKMIYSNTVDNAKESHRLLSKEELGEKPFTGKKGSEYLVENTGEKGRHPNLKEIVLGYLSNPQNSQEN
ncbi:MAG: ABC transporter ATP-binding protein [bacterium]